MTAMPIVQNKPDIANRVRTFLAKWRDAKLDPERGELSTRTHGDYEHGPYWEHGWWMAPHDWSLAVSVDYEDWAHRERYSFGFEVGPFAWSLDFFPWGKIQ